MTASHRKAAAMSDDRVTDSTMTEIPLEQFAPCPLCKQYSHSIGKDQLAASGYSSKLAASGEDSVIAASAPNCTASGADGTWISLAEFDRNGKCVGFATGCIGKDGLKADTLYGAHKGKLVEAA